MTPICSRHIHHPMAWDGGDFSKDDITFELTSRHVAALEDILLKVGGASGNNTAGAALTGPPASCYMTRPGST
jgi:hypothetical protein